MAKQNKKSLQDLTIEELKARKKAMSTIFRSLAGIFIVLIIVAIGSIFYLDMDAKKATPMLVSVVGGSIALMPLYLVTKSVDKELASRGV